jgi:hypothetical protein
VSDKVTVKVLLNQDTPYRSSTPYPYRNSTPYQSGHNLLQAITFEATLGSDSVWMLLHKIWRRLTTDDYNPRPDWQVKYRRQRHRSLWVGDVVVVGEQAFAVDRISKVGPVPRYPTAIWEPVHIAAQQISYPKPNPPRRGVRQRDRERKETGIAGGQRARS